MQPYDFLLSRHSPSSRLLGEPAPSPGQVARLLELAVHVPDHGRLAPWRFVLIEGETRLKLGERIATISRARHGGEHEAAIEKDRKRFAFAPLIVAVIARVTPNHKIPEQEQLLSAGAACMNLLYGAHALGFGAQWLTAWLAYDADVGALFSLGEHERIVGFIHIGTPGESVPDRERPDPRTLTTKLELK